MHKNLFLIAHNGRRFDFPVLLSSCCSIDRCDSLIENTQGMVDSLNIFSKVFPKRSSYKQEDLVRDILFTNYKAHNAEEDVNRLASLVSQVVTEHGDKHVQENSFQDWLHLV